MKPKLLTFCLLLALVLTGCALESQLPPSSTPDQTSQASQPAPPEPEDCEFVNVTDYLPGVFVYLPYANADNFIGQPIYSFTQPWLRYSTVKKLALVQQELASLGYSLLIWDGYRPISAQKTMWDLYPDPTYVSSPDTGSRSHCRGNTVDVTLVNTDGSQVEMPTGFDDFSVLADRDYSDCTPQAATNARLLEEIMKKYGFKPYYGEWWHYTDTQDYPIEEAFQPAD